MHPVLAHDAAQIDHILAQTLATAKQFLHDLPQRPVGVAPQSHQPSQLPSAGLGAEQTLEHFLARYSDTLTGSTGPRYWGFVTGGATPAALAGDWLVSTFDQNPSGTTETAAIRVENEAISMLRELFGLPTSFSGAFVSGATMANFVGLAIGRQWAAQQLNHDVARMGLYGLAPIPVLSGAPHSSIYKAMSMLGMGRQQLQTIALQPEREAVDIAALRQALQALSANQPAIVVANAGTVNSVDFDDLMAIAALKQEFNFWLHVDAAFGGFAACSPRFAHLVHGLEQADSLTIDAHKWLNVPYDSAMQFTRHSALQVEVFHNSAAYLSPIGENPGFFHRTPENSRRWRALPAWFTLMAYGSAGYQEMVERDCDLAQLLASHISDSPLFRLVAPVRMNVVCFTLAGNPDSTTIQAYLDAVRASGAVFMTATVYAGQPAIRAAFSNWRTTTADVGLAWQAMERVAIEHRA
ncbi:MAG TPA: aspartate aminotransferase family protein [Herpetosiphon sp.]|uniref:Pyridoxal-dependent decarboxylase n=1 Tax=Herpetosiphon aurantiacus (strain ATCC 23779 / DSM 785 / 114-95) TaxID=316274 RepID=A9B1K4_HERA2|nr:aminotransferase class I/II-fold pyridoxal phosphate-dependent enzyme [Herpetosiphon sp.]ABX03889.1 Pyridoxal-dependent decarboxylase [Herpetosiphon aurantiacus DSM 785]HBW50294.1 aspartate aminotransferase family protein [Herpetosiphon sp.]